MAIPKKPIGVHEVTKTTALATQVPQIHQITKNMITSFDAPTVEPIKVAIDVNGYMCLLWEGVHLFEEFSTNEFFVN